MYQPGDTVVYLTHGVGDIERREEREVMGEKREYFFIRFRSGMTSQVPVKYARETGLRSLISKRAATKVSRTLASEPSGQGGLWSHRVQRNEDKLKRGEAELTAEVVRDLSALERIGKISSSEHLLRRKAVGLLAQELGDVWKVDADEAEERIVTIVEEAAAESAETAESAAA